MPQAPGPRLFEDRATIQGPSARLAATATPDAYGAGVATALTRLGDTAGQVVQEMDARANEANAQEGDIQYQRQARDILWGEGGTDPTTNEDKPVGFYRLQGHDAVAARQSVTDRLSALADSIVSTRRSPAAQAALRDVLNRRVESDLSGADRYTVEQTRVYEDSTRQAAASEAAVSAVQNAGNISEAVANINTGIDIVRQQADAHGASEETTAMMIRNYQSPIWADIIQANATADPAAATNVLNARRPLMNPDDVLRSARAIQIEIERRQAEADRRAAQWRASVRDQIEASRYLWSKGEDDPHPASVETVGAALGPEMATAYAIDLASHTATAPLQRQRTENLVRLAQLQPSSGSQTDRLANIATRASAEAILAQRLQDPVQYSMRQGLVNDGDQVMTTLTSGNDLSGIGGNLRHRYAVAQEQNQRLGGMPMNVLTNAESTLLRHRLDAMSGTERLQVMRHLQTSLSSARHGDGGAYQALIRQVYADDPGSQMGAMALTRGGRVSGVDGSTAGRRMLEGSELLRPNAGADSNGRRRAGDAIVNMPSEAALRAAFNSHVGDAYKGSPQRQEIAYQGFRPYLAGVIAESGANLSDLGTSYGQPSGSPETLRIIDDAASVATGELRSNAQTGANPGTTYLPWGMSESDFNQSVAGQWAGLRSRYPGADLRGNPNQYDYAPAHLPGQDGAYFVYRNGAIVNDGQRGPVLVYPGRAVGVAQ